MLRFVFAFSGALYLALGGALYFFPAGGLMGFTVTPVWVARITGAVIAAWGAQLLVGSTRPTPAQAVGVIVANLLCAATLVPAALSGAVMGAPVTPGALIVAGAVLLVLAVLGIIAPRERSRL